jgi:hypothetical protein
MGSTMDNNVAFKFVQVDSAVDTQPIDITIAHYSEFFCHSERKKNFRIINSSQDAVFHLTQTVALHKDSESRFRLEQ